MADQFVLLKFERSKNPKKKYDAILQDKKTKRTQRVPFGSRKPLYEQYKDSTGLKLYSRLDHGDEKRRKAYKARHEKTRHKKFSASWFADNFLW